MTTRDATKEPCSLAELFASWGPVQLINPHEPRAFTKLAGRYADLLQLIHRLEARCAPSASGTPVAYIEHHKGGDNLVWDQTKERCTPLYKSAPAAQGTPEDKRDAERWRIARTIFSVEDIERAVRDMEGSAVLEEENAKADAAIDAAMNTKTPEGE